MTNVTLGGKPIRFCRFCDTVVAEPFTACRRHADLEGWALREAATLKRKNARSPLFDTKGTSPCDIAASLLVGLAEGSAEAKAFLKGGSFGMHEAAGIVDAVKFPEY